MKKIKSRELKFKLGDKVRDIISGYEGTVTATTQWFNGCNRYRIEPNHLKPDGELLEDQTFDEEQLEIIETDAINLPDNRTGGCRPNITKPKIMRR